MFHNKYANCHLHSTFSDAGFTPNQLVKIGKALGYGALALTDHETDGGCREFMEYAQKEGIETVSGAEFYGVVAGHAVHLTALDFDMDDPGIRAFIGKRCDLQYEATRKTVQMGIDNGHIQGITWDDIDAFVAPGMWVCIDTLYNTLRAKRIPFESDQVRKAVFKTPEALALKVGHPSAEEVIRAVRGAGGVIALAHPDPDFQEYIGQLVDWGLNGIETSHPDVLKDVVPLTEQAADTYKLYRCGGTDHSGPMSCCGGIYAYPTFDGLTQEEFEILKERRLG